MANDKDLDRANQFMAFSPLKGYYEMILEKEKIKVDKAILSEDRLEELDSEISNLELGDFIYVKYYSKDSYLEKEGILTKKDMTYKNIVVIKQKIDIDDIYDIKKL